MEQILTVTAPKPAQPVAVLAVVGEIDHDSQPLLRTITEKALARNRNRLVIDLSNVGFCDSGGLSLFVDIHKRAEAHGGWLRLAGTQRPVLSILQATNLDRLLALYGTTEAAVADDS